MAKSASSVRSSRSRRQRDRHLAAENSSLRRIIDLMCDVGGAHTPDEVVTRALSAMMSRLGASGALLCYYTGGKLSPVCHSDTGRLDPGEIRTLLETRETHCDACGFYAPLMANGDVVGALRLWGEAGDYRELAAALQPFLTFLGRALETARDHETRRNLALESVASSRNGLRKEIASRDAELEQARHDLVAILDNVPAAICYWDTSLTCRFSNRANNDWFAVSAGRAVGAHIQNVLDQDQYAGALPYVEGALRGEPQSFTQVTTLPLAAAPRHGLTYYVPDIRETGVVGFYALITDVTEIKRAEQVAEQANRAKTEFLAMMSHEIRTPLTGVLGMAQLLRLTPLSCEQSGYLDALTQSTRALLVILNDILDNSKIEAGKLALDIMAFDLRAVVRDVVTLNRTTAEAKSLRLTVEIALDVPETLMGDPTRVRQVVQNFVGNAIKFTDSGSVSLLLSRVQKAGDQPLITLEVSDTGIGIAPERQHELFIPFSQLDPSSTRRFGGSGLGLAISRRLVEMMGGEIGVESQPGRGSRFWFTLPLEVPPTARPKPCNASPVSAPERAPSLRILVAEDNRINRVLVATMLRKFGHTVEVAENGQEALAAVQAGKFDIVLMDMQMPVMDGSAATRAIRTLPGPRCRVPILALTADVLPDHRAQFLAAGVDGMVAKPIDWAVLNAALKSVMPPSQQTIAPNSPLGAELPGIDSALAMRRTDGMVELFWTLLADFIADNANDADLIARTIREGDLDGARRHAHSLRSVAGNLGATQMAAAAGLMEMALKGTPDSQALDDKLEALRASIAEVVNGARIRLPPSSNTPD